MENAKLSNSDSQNVILCPYCGHVEAAPAERCGKCNGFFDPLSRKVTQQHMGPWFIRDNTAPFRPGCSYEVITKQVEKGKITPATIMRGPTTKQFWSVARMVPGVAHLLGFCHSCGASVDKNASFCPQCSAQFSHQGDRLALGLDPDDSSVFEEAARAQAELAAAQQAAAKAAPPQGAPSTPPALPTGTPPPAVPVSTTSQSSQAPAKATVIGTASTKPATPSTTSTAPVAPPNNSGFGPAPSPTPAITPQAPDGAPPQVPGQPTPAAPGDPAEGIANMLAGGAPSQVGAPQQPGAGMPQQPGMAPQYAPVQHDPYATRNLNTGSSNTVIYILIGLIVILIVAVVLVFVFKGNKDPNAIEDSGGNMEQKDGKDRGKGGDNGNANAANNAGKPDNSSNRTVARTPDLAPQPVVKVPEGNPGRPPVTPNARNSGANPTRTSGVTIPEVTQKPAIPPTGKETTEFFGIKAITIVTGTQAQAKALTARWRTAKAAFDAGEHEKCLAIMKSVKADLPPGVTATGLDESIAAVEKIIKAKAHDEALKRFLEN